MKKNPSPMESEAREWNEWKPGSGRKGWSPFALKSFEKFNGERSGEIPLKDGKIDMKKWEEELKDHR